MPNPIVHNTLFYGDNLAILREHIPDQSIDLIYLDPPFNSNRSYNVLFKEESGKESQAQIEAFCRRTPDARVLPLALPGFRDTGFGLQLASGTQGCDGFFYASLERSA